MACCLATPSHCLDQWGPTNWYNWNWHHVVHVFQILMLGFFFQCVKCACMWTHIYVRPHITFPHKVILRIVVHVFQFILLTILYLFVCACLSVTHRFTSMAWWRQQMETFSALLAICAGSSPVTGEFPAQGPVVWSFDVFFDLRLNKQWSKQWEAGDLRCNRTYYDVTAMISYTIRY